MRPQGAAFVIGTATHRVQGSIVWGVYRAMERWELEIPRKSKGVGGGQIGGMES